MLPVLTALAAGAEMPVQTAVNSRLRAATGHPLAASLVNFAVGTLVLLLVLPLLAHPHELLSHAGQALTAQPWWAWTGGLLGVLFVTVNVLLFPRLGGVETVLWPVTGQLLLAVAIDTLGLLGQAHRPLGPARLGGVLLVVAGVLVAVALRARVHHGPRPAAGGTGARGALRWAWRGAGLVGGFATALQATVNGRLGGALGSPVAAGTLNFLLGTLALVLLTTLTRTLPRQAQRWAGSPWWMWTGGLLGAVYVCAVSWLVPALGTGLTMVLVLVGQTGSGAVVDHGGWLGAPRRPVDATQLVGLATMLAGAVLVRLG